MSDSLLAEGSLVSLQSTRLLSLLVRIRYDEMPSEVVQE